jgi:hypothetical protein
MTNEEWMSRMGAERREGISRGRRKLEEALGDGRLVSQIFMVDELHRLSRLVVVSMDLWCLLEAFRQLQDSKTDLSDRLTVEFVRSVVESHPRRLEMRCQARAALQALLDGQPLPEVVGDELASAATVQAAAMLEYLCSLPW